VNLLSANSKLGKSMKSKTNPFIRWLDQIHGDDRSMVGGKAANLGELIKAGISCPPGFCITTKAFEFYLKASGLEEKVLAILNDTSKSGSECASEISHLLQGIKVPQEVKVAIIEAYHQIEYVCGHGVLVAVRSSALVEDVETSSFAGQFDSFLGVIGEQDLITSVSNCWMSLFNARSIAYSRRKRVGTIPLAMAIIVQELVKAKKAGVMFTVHPVTLEKNHIVVEATFGLGEQLVSGQVSPDTYILSKDDFTIMQRNIVEKKFATFYTDSEGLVEREIDPNLQNVPALSDYELVELARLGTQIEALFGEPQDIEWALESGIIYIVQTRPITVL